MDNDGLSVWRWVVIGGVVIVAMMSACVAYTNHVFVKNGYCSSPYSPERWMKCGATYAITPQAVDK